MIAALIFWLCVLLVVYTYAGYPLLLALLARLRSHPVQAQPQTPSLTLLIAAYNEEQVIAARLENALAQDYPRDRLQILVAADGSTDETAALVADFIPQGVELSFSPERRGKMAAINHAMQTARGEIVVFSDANNIYSPDALRQLAAPFADPQVGAVSGAKVILKGDGALGDSEGLYWKYESFIKKQETRLGSCTGVAGEILAVRRSLFTPPPARVINDDFYLALSVIRRGSRVVYQPAARSAERVSASAQDEMIRRSRITAGRYQAIGMATALLPWKQPLVVWQVVSHKFLRPLVPFAMLGALLANLAALIWPPVSGGLLALAAPWNWVILAAQAAFYGAALLGSLTGGKGRLGKLLYLATFLVNSNAAALSGLARYLTGRQGAAWKRVNRRGEVQA